MEYGFYFEGEEINASVNQFNAALLGSIFLFQQLFLKQVRKKQTHSCVSKHNVYGQLVLVNSNAEINLFNCMVERIAWLKDLNLH